MIFLPKIYCLLNNFLTKSFNPDHFCKPNLTQPPGPNPAGLIILAFLPGRGRACKVGFTLQPRMISSSGLALEGQVRLAIKYPLSIRNLTNCVFGKKYHFLIHQ